MIIFLSECLSIVLLKDSVIFCIGKLLFITFALVFNKINISIKANTTVAFVGKTGSGKTTLIDLILGLLKPNEGKVIIDDVEINDFNVRNWQKTISYVPQQVYISDDSIINNIAFGENEEDINYENSN